MKKDDVLWIVLLFLIILMCLGYVDSNIDKASTFKLSIIITIPIMCVASIIRIIRSK